MSTVPCPETVYTILPESRLTAFRIWVRDNLDPIGYAGWGVPLETTATRQVTHYHFRFSGSASDVSTLLSRLILMVPGITRPATWNQMTPRQKRDWIRTQQPVVESAIGVTVDGAVNNGTDRITVETHLTRRGLRRSDPVDP